MFDEFDFLLADSHKSSTDASNAENSDSSKRISSFFVDNHNNNTEIIFEI